MARQASARLMVGSARRGRAALLRATALQAATALVFVTQAGAQPAPTARPGGGQVVAGSAAISQSTAQTTVNQASPRAALEWQSFDVGSQHTVQFNQPSTSAVTLNRVIGPDPSQIAGRIVANGNIIITNPAGVAFSQGAQVNVNGLIVSAPGITTQNFMAGNMVFDQAPKPGAAVTNAGTITVKEAGLAALVAPRVANSGVINARLGRVVLAGAEAHTIDLYGDGLVAIDVTKAVSQMPLGPDGKPVTALVTNTGTVIADGGSVQITARAADGIVQDLVRAGGTIRANAVGNRAGSVAISGVGGSVRVEGQIAADGGAGAGGKVAVTASNAVTVASGASISANGGGTVALGTTLARAQAGRQAALTNGASPGTPAGTARRVVVEAGATVSADATGAGTGGTVAVLSTQSTQIDGLLTTLGGGVIEASSDGVLALNRAPNAGQGGTLYLDPYDLVVGTGTPTVGLSGSQQFPEVPLDGSTSGTSYISPATLTQAAQNGAVSISLNATHDLTVREAVNLTTGQVSSGGGATGGASLSLHANNDLTVLANITIGAPGSGFVLNLDAGHNIIIGPTTGTPVTLAADGIIALTTTGSFTGDPTGASITVRDGSVLTSNGGISLEASNGIAIGNNVQMTGGPNGSVSLGGSEGSYAGIVLQAGGNITVGNNTTLSAIGQGDGYTPAVFINAGGSVTVGTQSQLNTSGTYGILSVYAGSSTELFYGRSTSSVSGGNANAPAVNNAGAVSIGSGTTINGTASIGIASGTAGQTTLAAGSLVDSNDFGYVYVYSGTGGTTLNGTVTGGSVLLDSGGAVQQSAGGVIITGDLSGGAASYNLIGTGNQITQIGVNESDILAANSGNITIVNSIPLTVGGSPGSTGGGIQVANGNTITLITDSLTIGAGSQSIPSNEVPVSASLYAPGGAVVIQPYSAGQQVELTTGTKTAGVLSVTQSELLNVDTDRLQLGSTTAGTLTVSGNLDLSSGRFTVDGGASLLQLDLVSGGQITQLTGSTIAVDTLTANGTDVALFGGGNQINNLGASSASTDLFRLTNATPLNVTGPITANGRLSAAIILQTDGLTFDTAGSLSTGIVQLTPYTAGTTTELVQTTPNTGRLSITQSMLDRITAGVLRIGAIDNTGPIVIGNAGDVVSVSIPSLSLLTSGAITEGAGAGLSASTVTITGGATAPASITLRGPNQIAGLAAQATGAIDVNNAASLTVDTLNSQTSINITTSAGNITVARTSATFDGSNNGISAPTVTLAAAGSLTFAAGTFPTSVTRANGTLTLRAGQAITQNAGTIVANTLTGSAASATLTQLGNQINNLGAFTATTGGFSLADSSNLSVTGGVSVANGQTLSLTSNSIQITGSGSITGGGSLSAPGGTVALAPYTAGTAFSFGSFVPAGSITAATLQVGNLATGDITLGGNIVLTNVGTLDLRSGASITQSVGGGLQVGTLTLQANSASLLGQNRIGTLGNFAVTNAFALTNITDLAINGAGSAASLTLAVSGAITQPAGALTTPTLTITGTGGTPPSSIALGGANQIDVLTAQSSGNITVNNAQALRVDVASTPGNVNLTTTSGNLTVARTGNTLDGTANGISGAVVTLNAGGSLLFDAGSHPENVVRATTSLALGAGAAITQSAGALITPLLSGNGTSATLTQPGNQVTRLGAFTTTAGFSLADSVDLTVSGAVSAGTGQTLSLASNNIQFESGGTLSAPGGIVALAPFTVGSAFTLSGALQTNGITADTLRIGSATTGNITIAGTFALNNVGTLDLQSGAAIIESVGGALQVGTLTLQAASASLTGPNQIGTLGAFSVPGALALTNAGTLAVTGPGTAGSLTLTVGGDIAFGGTINSAGGIALAASGAITQSAGTLTTGTLSVAGTGGTLPASISLGAANQIGVLTAQSRGDITVSNAQALRVDVASTPGNVTIGTTAGDLLVARTSNTFDGTDNGIFGAVVSLGAAGNLLFEVGSHPENVVRATTSLALNGGTITQDFGTIITPQLTGFASGSASLAQAGNQVGQLGNFIVSNDFTLSDSVPLTVGGLVSVGTGRTLSLASDSLQIGASGGLSAPGGIVAIAPLTVGNPLTLTSAPSGNIVADTLRLGSNTTGDITIAGTFNLTNVGALDLRSAGNISESVGGSLQVGTLTGQANSATLTGPNQIDQLGDFIVAGVNLPAGVTSAFRLRNDKSLTVVGNVSASNNGVVIDTSFARDADVTVAVSNLTNGGDYTVYAGRNVTIASSVSLGTINGSLYLEAAFNANDPAAAGSVHINGPLYGSNVVIGAGVGGIDIGGQITGNSVILRGQGNADPSLVDLYRGPITQSAGIITTASLSARGTSVLLTGNNQIAALGTGAATTGNFVLATTSSLNVTAPTTVSSGATIAIASNGIQFNGGGLSAPAGLIALTPFTAGGSFAVGGNLASGAVTAGTLQIGNATTGPINIAGNLNFDQVGTLDLRSAGAISQGSDGELTVANLTLQAASATLAGNNTIGTLGAFNVTNTFALTNAGNLVVAGPGSAGALTLTTGGAVQFAGDLAVTRTLSVNSGGSVMQTGGTLTAATLTGSASGSAQFGVSGATRVNTLGAFAVVSGSAQVVVNSTTEPALSTPTSFNLANGAPLAVTGPLSAGTVAVSAPGSITLQNGQVSADNAVITVTSPLNGSALLTQTGTTGFNSLSNTPGALTLSLPDTGGAVTLQNLNAPGMSLALNLGTGTATGAINVAALQVFGQSGGTSLSGTVGGETGGTAAAISAISPNVNTAYTLNGCTISVANCGLVTGSEPALPVPATPQPAFPIVTLEPTFITDDFVALFTPKSFLDTALGNIFKSNLFIVDLITIGIIRNPADPDLMLPNISDRDY